MNEEEHMSTRDGDYCIWTRMSLFHHSSDYANITLPLPTVTDGCPTRAADRITH